MVTALREFARSAKLINQKKKYRRIRLQLRLQVRLQLRLRVRLQLRFTIAVAKRPNMEFASQLAIDIRMGRVENLNNLIITAEMYFLTSQHF